MVTRTVVTLIDDLDGQEADDTVRFAFDGHAYEIDLAAGNAIKLRDSLAPYVAAGRRIRNSRVVPVPPVTQGDGSTKRRRARRTRESSTPPAPH